MPWWKVPVAPTGPLWPDWIQGRKQSLGQQAVPPNFSEERFCILRVHQKAR